jgi:hypothetical protein
VIASGYGRIDRRATGDSPNTTFGAALSLALKGAADRAPFGNCDAIVTDEEATAFVDSRLRQGARGNWDEWQVQPTAVLKRNVDFALPLIRVTPSSACSRPNWDEVKLHLPGPLHEALRVHLAFLQGAGRPPDGYHRFLVLAKSELAASEFARSDFSRYLMPLAARLGWQVIDTPGLAVNDLAIALRASSFLDVLVVKTTHSAFGGFYIELTSPRDRALLWAHEGPLPAIQETARELAENLAHRLHGRFELIVLESAGAKRLILRVRGEVPRRLTALPWGAFVQGQMGGGTGAGHTLELLDSKGNFRLAVSPCPGAVGQCFFLDDSTLSQNYEDWALVTGPT